MPDHQRQAMRRAQDAWQKAIGLIASGVVSWVVISNGTLDDYASCKGMRRQTAAETLGDALDRLADFYQVGDVQPPKEFC
ncbi:hypothetical protein [Roseomonas chloroacetimidivorans]|uniref:hypothetical protein n=1 Tax=Roseomonas chloroacetimidivorans TaxID=1766656 RepID=UPI003C74C355